MNPAQRTRRQSWAYSHGLWGEDSLPWHERPGRGQDFLMRLCRPACQNPNFSVYPNFQSTRSCAYRAPETVAALSSLSAYKTIFSEYVLVLLCFFSPAPLCYKKLTVYESKIINLWSLKSLWSYSRTKENFAAALRGMFLSCFRKPWRS